MAELRRPVGSVRGAPPSVPRKPEAEDTREEVGRSTSLGWRPDIEHEALHAKEPEARRHGGRQHKEAGLAILPGQYGALSFETVPQFDEEPANPPVLVVPVPEPDS